MKIWGNDLKVGDEVYYIRSFKIEKDKIASRDNLSFRMPSWITEENGDRLFVNDWYYTEKEDLFTYNVIEDLKKEIMDEIERKKKEIDLMLVRIPILTSKLEKLNEFK